MMARTREALSPAELPQGPSDPPRELLSGQDGEAWLTVGVGTIGCRAD